VAAAWLAPAVGAPGWGEPLVVGGKTVLTLRASAGGLSAHERSVRLRQRVNRILSHPELEPDDVEVEVGPGGRSATIWVGRQLLVTATLADAAAHDTTPARLARTWAEKFRDAYERTRG
jgi:hypothetical protein